MTTTLSRTTRRAVAASIGLAALAATAGLMAQATQPAAPAAPPTSQALRAGHTFMPVDVHDAADDAEILKAFAGLRVADVTDGLDVLGLHNVGLMDPSIHALWKDTEKFTHRFIGIAVTARYVPTQRAPAGKMTVEAYDRWAGKWYNELSPEPFVPLIRAGSVVVIEDAPDADVGSIGSNNIMGWKQAGAVGVVTSATARDTDEIITQKIPLYLKRTGRGIRPGRNEIESVNRPVVVGGATVMPGDVIVADGDGVLVVPRQDARDVAAYAHKILAGDKEARRQKYKELGLPEDDSVR